MFPEHIETDRLTLSRFCHDTVDADALYELFGAGTDGVAMVFEYVPQTPFQTFKEAYDMIERAESSWKSGEMALYAVYLPDDDNSGRKSVSSFAGSVGEYCENSYVRQYELAGYTALSLEWERRTGTIGIILATPYWGREYAGECADALTELAFERLDLELVAIGYETGNEKSERMIEKYIETYGGQYDGLFRNWTPIDDSVLDHHRYTVTQEQYTAAME